MTIGTEQARADLYHGLIAVPERVDGDARREVEILAALSVPSPAAFSMAHHKRWACIHRQKVRIGTVKDLLQLGGAC
jgi:hypothetical protein